MKTKEELNALKEEVEMMNKKLSELTEKDLAQVSGGQSPLPADPEPLTRFPTAKQIGMGTIPAATQDREIFEKLGILLATEFDIPDSN